jgi:acyl-coenzyme A thioesterase PaaI-like protein
MSDDTPALQDFYPEDVAHCYGCGRLNDVGLKLRTRWDGDETVTIFTPAPHHTAMPGTVYGGLVASVLDCAGTGSASAAALRAEGRAIGEGPSPRFVTAALKVDFLKPTPLGPPMLVRGRIAEIKGRKVVVEETLSVEGTVTATGHVVAVRLRDDA